MTWIVTITFLAGKQAAITNALPGTNDKPNAYVEHMELTFWIKCVEYNVVINKINPSTTQVLFSSMFMGARVPTPRFTVRQGGMELRRGRRLRVMGCRFGIRSM